MALLILKKNDESLQSKNYSEGSSVFTAECYVIKTKNIIIIFAIVKQTSYILYLLCIMYVCIHKYQLLNKRTVIIVFNLKKKRFKFNLYFNGFFLIFTRILSTLGYS